MRRHLLLVLLLALLVGVVPASAHDGHGAHPTHRDTIQEVNFDFAGAVEDGERATAAGYGDAGRTYLPKRWCGTTRAGDDTANQVHDASLPQVKMVYAYAADQEDRTVAWADLLQANVSLISRFYAQQSDGLRAPRFDLGTHCGAQYADIATVRLPEPRTYYADSFDRIELAVDAALPRTAGQPRNYVILADKLSTQAAGYLWGQGSMWGDASKGTSNWNNRGGTSIIYIPQAQTLPTTSTAKDNGFWPEGFLHEMSHNFGAVQDSSPNSTQAGHCRDGRDVMCYADGGLSYSSTACPGISTFTSQFVQVLDCHRDDYFSPAPVAASWLDTHMNTFDNVFNGDCPALGDQCGGGVAPAVTGGPGVTGFTKSGSTLTAQAGTWSGDPQLTWQWEEEVSGTWQPYAHDSLTLALGAAHVGRRYRIKVTAAGAETVVARSHPTAAVTSGTVTPTNTARPQVTGLLRTGSTLAGSIGTWTNAQTYARQWFRYHPDTGAEQAIAGAVGDQYTLLAGDAGYRIALRVQATSSTGTTVTAWSDQVGPVGAPPVNQVAPAVTGTAKVGRTLSASTGTWSSGWTITYARQWQRLVQGVWQPIEGATGTSYVAQSADVAHALRVLVTATNEHGSTGAASQPTADVAALSPPVNLTEPVAGGEAQQGKVLTAEGDTWSGASQVWARWERRVAGGDWVAIDSATTRHYTLQAADVDAEVRVVLTAENEDGSASKASAPRGPVVTGVAPENSAPPQVSGTPRTGQALTATTGTWLRANSYTYEWHRFRDGGWYPIAGADQAAYTPVQADAGLPLRVWVTATGWGGSTSAPSAATQPVADPPVAQSAPAISGIARQGATLTASPGSWLNALSYEYRWQRGGGVQFDDIAGATGATYVPVAGDVGHELRVLVTAVNATDRSEPAASAPTAQVVASQPPASVSAPVVVGTLYQGETLTAADDQWTGEPTLSVQWQRRAGDGWSDIAGATARTYTLTAADLDGDVRVSMRAVNEDGELTVASVPRGPVDGDPANVEPPQVIGTPRTGQTLTATAGTWRRATTYAYAWQRLDGQAWAPIAGATASTYDPVAADAGLPLRVVVTATGSRASASASSAPTGAVVAPPVMQVPPAISGTAKIGRTLTASTGTWTGATGFAHTWERQTGTTWDAIAGATGDTYVPTSADVGHPLRVRVTATGAHGEADATSGETVPVVGLQPPVNVRAPAVTGTLYEGETLTAGGDEWTGATSTSVVWQRRTGSDWAPIAGAAQRTYTLTAADLGAEIRALVTALNEDGEAAAPSTARGPVDGDPVNTVRPLVTGTPRVGRPLTASTGTWLRAATFAYAWQRYADGEWSVIPGATGSAYTPVMDDGLLPLRVVVTGTGSRASGSAASDPTAPVDPQQAPQNLAPPVVSGVLYDGETLTAGGDDWTGATSTGVQWQRRVGTGEWTPIDGATARTYTLVPADVGHAVRASVTATNAAGDTTRESAARGPVDGDPSNTVAPAISGSAREGQPLTATAGTWLRAGSLAFAWERRAGEAWAAIPGATAATYTPVAADAGLPLRVRVTGTGSRASASAFSPPTDAVAGLPVSVVPEPDPIPSPAPATNPPPVQQSTPAARGPVRLEVVLRSGRKKAGKLVVTVTGTAATVGGARLKLPAGAYTARFCAGRRCVTRKLKIARGRLKTKVTLPAASGAIKITLKPKRGRLATGRLLLAG